MTAKRKPQQDLQQRAACKRLIENTRAACFSVNTWVQPHIFWTQEIIYKGLRVKLCHECENSHWMQRPMSFSAFSLIFTFKGLDLKEDIEHFFLCEGLYKCKSPERMFREEKNYKNVFLAGYKINHRVTETHMKKLRKGFPKITRHRFKPWMQLDLKQVWNSPDQKDTSSVVKMSVHIWGGGVSRSLTIINRRI